jgi:beta-lactamase class A
MLDLVISRRDLALGLGAAALLQTEAGATVASSEPRAWLRDLERSSGGRLGAHVHDVGTGRSFGWRADERFCHCSTFKLSLAAMILREADAGRLDPTEPVSFSKLDLVGHSPVVEQHLVVGRLSILDLAEAVQVTSDNAAANLLLRRLGGPGALTRFWRDIGDTVSRIDSYEPDVNVIPPGTDGNSTTPRAMAGTVRQIMVGDVLKPSSRNRLSDWMAATRTGLGRIRAGLPPDWQGLDKTGTGMREGIGNKTNDLAVLMPPNDRAPMIVVGYFEHPVFSKDTRPADEAVLRSLGQQAAAWHASL